MTPRHVAWLISALLAGAAVILGYQAMTSSQEATVLVEWTTASELDTAGFNVYRSDSPDGPFLQANDRLIPASPDPLTGGSYVFTDTAVVAGRTYYYQLEDVETDGTTTRHGFTEVTAESQGRMQKILSVILLGAAALSTSTLILTRQRNSQLSAEHA